MNVTIEDINQSIRLLEELKHNLKETETANTEFLLNLQDSIKHRFGFPKYCLNVRISVRKYFLNVYADMVYRIMKGMNNGIPLKLIQDFLNKQACENKEAK